MLGSNPSVVSGTKTEMGRLDGVPFLKNQILGIGTKAENPRGLGTESP